MRMCPAKNAKCFSCARIGHYAHLCLSRKQQVNFPEEMGYSNPCLLMLDAKCQRVSFLKPLVNATVQPFAVNNSSNVLYQGDTGADVPILCKPTHVNTFQDVRLIGLDKLAIVLTAYSGTDIMVLGSVTEKIIGSLPGEYTIQLKPNAQSVQLSPLSVPLHLKNSYKSELHNFEQQGVIRKLTQYTEWVNGIVIF